MGTVLTLLVLEAARRTTGLVLPAVCVAFFLYAYYGGYLPTQLADQPRRDRLQPDHQRLYNDQSGFYGIPLDVCATYIVLFTIYGAVLDATGAGAVLHRPELRRVPPVPHARRAAPWRCPGSCSARCPAPAPRPRSASAR